MNSDKAAAVRDSINGCPGVAADENTSEYGGEPFTGHDGNTYTGEFIRLRDFEYKPAHIEQSGTVGDGEGASRPVYVVVLEPTCTEQTGVRSLPSEMVYEIAKHDCSIRHYPPGHRLGGDKGAFWIVDHFTEDLSESDGDRCPDCGSTYFKIRDGEPECARCGTTEETARQVTFAEAGGGR